MADMQSTTFIRKVDRAKEDIRQLKCKVLKFVDQIRPRLTWHLQYLQKRYDLIQEKVDSKSKGKLKSQVSLLNSSLSQTGINKKVPGSTNTISSNLASLAPSNSGIKLGRLSFGRFKPKKQVDEIKDPYSRYFVKVDIIEELCALLTVDEIDQIAEDPKFYFPTTENDRYKELWDVEKWNYIADRLTMRISPNRELDKQVSLPNLKRFLPMPPASLTIPQGPKCLLSQSRYVDEKDIDWRQWIEDANHAKSEAVGVSLKDHFQVVSENKLTQNQKWKEVTVARLDKLSNKMEYAAKTAAERQKQIVKIREDKQMRAYNNRLEREERLEKLKYNQEMLVMNERIKDLCKKQIDKRQHILGSNGSTA